jgi:hypothetical protein
VNVPPTSTPSLYAIPALLVLRYPATGANTPAL